MSSKIHHRGFTIVELLVLIAIVAVLLALLLPAIQALRESSRKQECQSHLKQIGVAISLYHDTHKCFPPAAITAPESVATRDFERFDGFGWQTMILPYLEMSALYDQLNIDGRYGAFRWYTIDHKTHYPGFDTVIPVYRCPSSGLPWHSLNSSPDKLPSYRRGYAITDYQASSGGGPSGVIVDTANAGSVRLRHIRDGAEHTLLAGESSYPGKGGAVWPLWGGYVGSLRTAVFLTRQGHTINCGMTNRRSEFWTDANYDMCATSFHRGGVNFVFADGHVQFLSEEIDPKTYIYLGGRNDGRLVSNY